MAASLVLQVQVDGLATEIVDGAPGGIVTLNGTGLTGGANAKVELLGQGADGSLTTNIANPTFADDGTSVTFTVPDGAVTGDVRVTAQDGTSATCTLTVNSQYVFGSQYIGEGTDDEVAGMKEGELDAILRRASQYADSYLCQGSREAMTLRLLQTIEQHTWRKRTRRVWPWRAPIVSVDDVTYIASPALSTQLPSDAFIVEPDLGYIEMVLWSMGQTYITALAGYTMYDAGIVKLTYTAGYSYKRYPQALREATTMIATALIAGRRVNKMGLSGLDSVRQGYVQYDRRAEPFDIPMPAKVLLNSLRSGHAS